jgi:NADPH:quinone reductase-like Zn-dependent oxidoreductase
VRCDFAQGVDCVFDDSGNPETVAKAMACLKPGGTFLSIVDRYKDLERDDVRNRYFDARPSGADLAELARLVDAGKLRLLVDRVFPVEKAREALAKVEDGHVHGKVVLKVA